MATLPEGRFERVRASQGCMDHDLDLINELGKRLNGLWRYDQYIANAQNKPSVRAFWETIKHQEEQNVSALKRLVADEFANGRN